MDEVPDSVMQEAPTSDIGLQEQLEEFIPATTALLNERLSLQSNFEVQQLFGNTTITQLSLVLDSPISQLQINPIRQV